MLVNKIVSRFDEAGADVPDGAVLMVGGFGTPASCPSLLLEALARKGLKDLTDALSRDHLRPLSNKKEFKALTYEVVKG